MATTLLTKRTVDAALPGAVRYELFDSKLKGFGLRVSPSGEKSWFIVYRPGDGGRGTPKRRVTLGKVGPLTPDQARDAAQRLLSSVKLGADPATAKAARRSSVTVRELVELFLKRHVEIKRKVGTAAHYTDVLNRIVTPALGPLKADAVTRADITALHLQWKHTPFQANRMLAIIGSMYAFGARAGITPEGFNPARGVERYPEAHRDRFLNSEELERLGSAIREAETMGVPWRVDESKPGAKHLPKDHAQRRTKIGAEAAAALRLLIFTGARLREILHLKWSEVDLERGLLHLGDSKTGRKTILLNASAIAVIRSLPRVGPYVIPGDSLDAPRADLKRPWRVVAQRAGLTGVRLHDLRHTFASFGASGGVDLYVIGKLLGHADVTTTQRYAGLGSDPLRVATESIANTIAKAMGESIQADAPREPHEFRIAAND